MATVTDYLPYFYIAVPRGFTHEDIEPFRQYLNVSAAFHILQILILQF